MPSVRAAAAQGARIPRRPRRRSVRQRADARGRRREWTVTHRERAADRCRPRRRGSEATPPGVPYRRRPGGPAPGWHSARRSDGRWRRRQAIPWRTQPSAFALGASAFALRATVDKPSRAARQFASSKLPVHFQRLANDFYRVRRPQQILHDHLLVLENLVVLEEAADLAKLMDRQLRLVGVVGERGIADADRDDLVVEPLLVPHPHDADRARL